MSYTRITTGTPQTDLTIAAGTLANINDNNVNTTCAFAGTAVTTNWFQIDLGASYTVSKAEVIQWNESSGADVGYTLRYSNTPLTGTTTGTAYAGSSFAAVQAPSLQDTVITDPAGTVTARYWALTRSGNFGGINITAADFNLYVDSTTSWLGKYH